MPLYWTQLRLIRRDVQGQYKGRTHEVFGFHERLQQVLPLLPAIGVCDYHDGSSHDVKLERDLHLLQLDLQDNPDNGRALFYLGNTLAQLGQAQAAREAWLRRSALPEDDEATQMGARWYAARGDTAELEDVFRVYQRPGMAHELATHYREHGQAAKCRAICRHGIALAEQQRRTINTTGTGFADTGAIAAMQGMLAA